MRKTWLSNVLIFGLLATPALAKEPATGLVQSRYNAQIHVRNLGDIAPRIDQLCAQSQAQITSFNSDSNNGNGNLNVRVPEARLGAFIASLRGLGVVRNESRSISDNTSSFAEAQRQLELAEKSLASQWTIAGANLSAAEKGLVDAEFKAYLRDRINSYRSNMNNYEQNRGWAEVSVNLKGPQAAPGLEERHQPPTVVVEERTSEPGIDPKLMALALFGPALLMLGLISVYLLKQYRSFQKSQDLENR